jgi:hypothetical protein
MSQGYFNLCIIFYSSPYLKLFLSFVIISVSCTKSIQVLVLVWPRELRGGVGDLA